MIDRMNCIIIQARMGSTRLPAKVLRPISGKPLLEYLVERLQASDLVANLVIATSTSSQDDSIDRFCKTRGISCFRGSLTDVADRFLKAADMYGFESFVRLSGDSPLLDTHIITNCLNRYHQCDCDLVTNIFPRTFPRGQSVEIVRTSSLRRARAIMDEVEDLEHVTRVYYRKPDQFRIENVTSESEYSPMHLAVDTPEDWETCAAILHAMQRPHWEYGLKEIAELYRTVVPNGVAR